VFRNHLVWDTADSPAIIVVEMHHQFISGVSQPISIGHQLVTVGGRVSQKDFFDQAPVHELWKVKKNIPNKGSLLGTALYVRGLLKRIVDLNSKETLLPDCGRELKSHFKQSVSLIAPLSSNIW
jgi:hypothetical protein